MLGLVLTAACLSPRVHACDLSHLPVNIVEAEDRGNVTVEGESLPLGLVAGYWSSSRLVTQMVSILVEQLIGFNTLIIEQDSTLDALNLLAGCPASKRRRGVENDGEESTCTSFSRFHVFMEAWSSQLSQRDLLMHTEITAPKNLGFIGYHGLEGLYLADSIVFDAEKNIKVPLTFFKSYDASRYTQRYIEAYKRTASSFFSAYTDINVSRLMRCSELGGINSNNHEMHVLYLNLTEDIDGVEKVNGSWNARCKGGSDGHWWLSPICRSDPSTCIPVIDTHGFYTDAVMQRATTYHMPVAYAIARPSEYASLPFDHDVAFYWWKPDSVFLHLDPHRIVFPPYDSLEWEAGDKRRDAAPDYLTKFVYWNLTKMSGPIRHLIQRFKISGRHIDHMLRGMTTESLQLTRSIACSWLQNNSLVWTNWIADATSCFPGYGWVSDNGSHVQTRDKAKRCAICESGYFSKPYKPRRSSYMCEPCRPGTYQDSRGQSQCKNCMAGNHGAERGMTACDRCPIGRYSSADDAIACDVCLPGRYTKNQRREGNSHCSACSAGTFTNVSEWQFSWCQKCGIGRYIDRRGQSYCHRCGAGRASSAFWTTMQKVGGLDEWIYFEGAEDNASCGCDKGWRLEDGECIECGEGMICDGMGEIVIKAGYHSELPVSVHHCFADVERCPGGLPQQTCASGRRGISCSQCEDWKKPSDNGTCVDCEGVDGAFIYIFCASLFVIVTVLYLLFNYPDNVGQSTTVMHASIALSQLVTFVQHLCIIETMSVDFGEPTKSFLESLRVFAFRSDIWRIDCHGIPGQNLARFIFTMSGPFAFLLAVLVIHAVASRAIHCYSSGERSRLGAPKAVGKTCMLLYVAVILNVTAPLQCTEHPNGKFTVRAYQTITCFDDDSDHTAMVVFGMCCLTFPIAFLVLALWVTLQLPSKVRTGNVGFLEKYSFLICHFDPDSFWYINVLLIKSLCAAICPVLPDPAVQVFVTDLIHLSSLILLVLVKPWRVPRADALDIVFTSVVMIVVIVAAFFVVEDDTFLQALSRTCLYSMVGSMLLVPLIILKALYFSLSNTLGWEPKRYKYFLCHHKASAGAFSRLLKSALIEHPQVKQDVFLDSDNLDQLDDLFQIVANDVETVLILGTKGVFLRPWCAGEMTIARLKQIPVKILAFPDWQLPDDETIQNYPQLVDMTALTAHRISENMVRTTLRWLAGLPTIDFPRRVDTANLDELINALVPTPSKLCGAWTPDSDTILTAKSTSLDFQISEVFILADDSDPEAVASAHVLARFMLPHTMHSPSHIPKVVDSIEWDEENDCKLMIIMCTNGCFERLHFMSALVRACRNQATVMPVVADPNFKFPTSASLSEMRGRRSMVSNVSGDELADLIGNIFKEIAAVFQPQNAPDAVLRADAARISERVIGGKARRSVFQGSPSSTKYVIDHDLVLRDMYRKSKTHSLPKTHPKTFPASSQMFEDETYIIGETSSNMLELSQVKAASGCFEVEDQGTLSRSATVSENEYGSRYCTVQFISSNGEPDDEPVFPLRPYGKPIAIQMTTM